MAMTRTQSLLAATSILALLSACSTDMFSTEEVGTVENSPLFGQSVVHNTQIHSGEKTYTIQLAERFSREVPDTITFDFNSAQIDAEARAILAKQANFIRQFPEVRFRVYGHTDLVGSAAYNKNLGLRRAQAVVSYFASQGISRNRLEAMVSYGETRPVVNTADRERRNRRTVTEVSGFVQENPLILNGKYAEVIARGYITSGQSESTLGAVAAGGGAGGVNNAATGGGGGGE